MSMLPLYFTELRLKGAFRGYSTAIEDCFLSSTRKEIFIADSEDAHFTILVEQDSKENITGRALQLNNPEKHDVVILQIDNKLISSRSRQKRCDCAILDANRLCFVEFKTNAQGNSVSSIHKTYEQAIEQLSATLHLFIEKEQRVGITLQNKRKMSAHICTAVRFPRLPSTQVSYAIHFALQEGIPLSFGQSMDV